MYNGTKDETRCNDNCLQNHKIWKSTERRTKVGFESFFFIENEEEQIYIRFESTLE